MDRREYGGHRHVHPDVDRSELFFRPSRRRLDGRGVRDVGRDRKRPRPVAARLLGGGLQPVRVSRQQYDVAPVLGEFGDARPSNSGAGACDHHDLRHLNLKSFELANATSARGQID